MTVWRNDRPTLRSERRDGRKDTFLVKWQFGLAGIAAEAEDANWAKRLTEQEAELACRYAPMELNGFPSWFESLAVEHPAAVDRVLGEELSLSLREVTDANAYSMFLQNISYAAAIISALFVPRIRSWLVEVAQADPMPNNPQFGQNLRQAIEILIKSGNDDDRRSIEMTARQHLPDGLAAPFSNVWLPALLHLNPVAGVDALERGLKEGAAPMTDAGMQLFAELFDRDHGGIGFDLSGFFGLLTGVFISRTMRSTKATGRPTRGTMRRKAGTRCLAPCSRRWAPRVGLRSSKWLPIPCSTTSKTGPSR
jgi:hypothetical protein